MVVALLIIGGGAYAYYEHNQNKAIDNQQVSEYQPQTTTTPAGSTPLTQGGDNTQPAATSTPQTTQPVNSSSTTTNPTPMTCQRNFDQNKLNTAKVDIKNKTVEFNVKDFGIIKLALYDQDAPKTVENFLRLVNSGYYDCLTFHRVAKGFVIQGGDPNGNGTGGISAFGDKFADELNAETPSYKAGYVKGVLAMANSGPNTNGSQFFIMLGDNTSLPHAYSIFGKVSAGLDVVDKIGQVDITPGFGPTDGTPKTPVVIEKATITSK